MIKIRETKVAPANGVTEFAPPTWNVYLVRHPITKATIYVGMTASVSGRRGEHIAPQSRTRAFIGGLEPEFTVIASYDTQDEALDHEIRLISETKGLMNERMTRATGRPRLGEEAKTIEHNKPWIELGMSRRTWYMRRKEAKAKPTSP